MGRIISTWCMLLSWIALWFSFSFGFPRKPQVNHHHSKGFTIHPNNRDRHETITLSVRQNNDGDELNPDLLGVKVEGFPLPSVPVREDDEDLMASMRRVPLSAFNDKELIRRRELSSSSSLRILIAGGGLGGLTLATALNEAGYDVHVLERARQYKPFGGPIQIQSNALETLRKIKPELYEAIAQVGVVTGDRLSGIKDGKRYEDGWLVKFDAATPAKRKQLPLTLAINRVVLQEIFLKYGVPRERVHTNARVIRYETLPIDQNNGDGGGVAVHLQNGTTLYTDILVGADGIWSTVRHQMYNLLPSSDDNDFDVKQHERYTGYTCYTGTCAHIPEDIQDVAYKVFLGQKQYFGCTDCGSGWQHWWAFLPDPPNCAAQANVSPDQMWKRLQHEFQTWSPEIRDLLDATLPNVIQRRDLYDRLPLPYWTKTDHGAVALLGDAAHPTMPNLGQGGAMAMEDAYVLSQELEGISHTDEIPQRLKAYEKRRYVRASIAQFLSRNGSDLLQDWDKLRNTPIIGPIAMSVINLVQPITMDYLYTADI